MRRRLAIVTFGLLVALATAGSLVAQIDPELLAGMKARSIGPAGMSGRIADIVAVESNSNIIYVGASTGGVWKSVNGGITWTPIFDDQPVHSIGALAVFQANPDIVWVGTGEGNTRNSVSVGNGIYRSLDAGRTWTHLGLADTERIHRVLLHPTNPDVAYVCAPGKLWGENPERGVFKTEDGGKTWKKILYVNEKTGCGDLAMDPANPDKLIAGMWEHRRWPWFFRSGGPGSGMYVTVDGGITWKRRTEDDGLPTGHLGRMGIAFFRSDSQIVYALVEAEKSALLRSEDGGWTWKKVNEEATIAPRPFYYADIRVDPERPNRIYNLHSQMTVSDDSGKTFRTLIGFNKLHPDHHAMWINPRDPRHIIEGNDGGVGISYDRGETWRFVSNLPLAQFYHVNVDMSTPYRVMGGLQDNGSWWGPSSVWENGGIRNQHWEEVGFGDGFDVLSDPQEPWIGYSMSQEGYLMRWNVRTGERKDIRPPAPDGVGLRFNWNSALAIDPFEPRTIYYGSQFVHKSTDRGDTWMTLSPDLTTNNPEWQKQNDSGGLTPDVSGAENFTTIISIAPSAVERGVIWVGTDDGRLHVTRDAGKTWTSVEKNVKGVPENTWIPHIRPSRFSGAAAFVVFDDHRRSNWTPYVFKTTDYGRTWTSLASKDIRGYALAIEQDTVKEDLLFLGTEFGLYVSLDGGKSWFQWKHGVPTASAMDLAVHPRESDLVIATHGRSLYILDDIRPLRSLTAEVLKEPLHLFEPPEAQQYMIKQTGGSRFPGQTEFRGENRPYGALLTYSLNFDDLPLPSEERERERKEQERQARAAEQGAGEEKKDEKKPQVDISITDASGKTIRSFKGPAVRGVNRAVWNLRRDAFKEPRRDTDEPSFFEPSYLEVLPGIYGVTVKYKDKEAKGTIRVVPDPRYDIPMADREAKWAAIERAGALLANLSEAIDQLRDARSDIEVAIKKVEDRQKDKKGDEKQAKELLQAARTLQKSLNQMERRLWVPPRSKGIQPDTDVMVKVRYVLRSLGSSWDKPTDAQLTYLRQAEAEANKVLADFDNLFATEVADFRRRVREAAIELLPEKPAESKQE
ncbi:MAG TPA: hypothetical protein VNN18_11160 [Candidatus Xenobia bacterium]|nr:hypothetical protein [Candidatus Xenobia bacterium]